MNFTAYYIIKQKFRSKAGR